MSGWPPESSRAKRLLPMLLLGVIFVTAGCLATPFDGSSHQEQPVRLVLNNSANETYTFDVWEVDLGANLTLHYRDGTVVNLTVGQGLSSHDTGPRTITEIDFPDSAQQYGHHTLSPGQEYRRNINNFSTNGALVVTVSQGQNDIHYDVSANCDELPLVGLEVVVFPKSRGGISASYGCQY